MPREMRFRVEDWSMAPTFIPGEVIHARGWKIGSPVPLAGEIVVVRDPEDAHRKLVKRVQFVQASPKGPVLFLIGDNELRSRDSRQFGPVSIDRLVGIVTSIDPSKPA